MGTGFDPRSALESPYEDAGQNGQTARMRTEKAVAVDLLTGELVGDSIKCAVCTLGDLLGVFLDEVARGSMDPNIPVYRVQTFCPVAEGVEGGLFWGTTFLEPGLVGDEYFTTRGHYHSNRDRSEFYLTLKGSGALLLMDEHRKTVFEPMRPNSLHYIPPRTAHRVANTGDSVLVFQACWPSDAGHDYANIAREGFSARLRKVGGIPRLVEER